MGNTRVFISSVQSEFQDERRRIAEYIRHDAALSRFFEPFLFEELPAQDKSAQMAYLTEASKSGIYLLLIGERYGYEDAEGVSPTEREYDAATAGHAYRIAFIKNTYSREAKEDAFKQRIDADVIRNTFSTYEELQSGVYASLVEYMMGHHMLRTGPWDSAVCLHATMEDLDKEKIRWFVGLAREKRQFPLQYSDEAVPQILQSLHLLTDEGQLRNAAMLLFAKDPQRWFVTSIVKCAHFYGTKMTKPIASLQQYGGSVFEMVDLAVSFVMSRIDQRVGERTHSAEVDVTPELPAQAVTEAIVNAVVHRDYTSNGSVQVMLFKDRLEVWNPGRLPQGMTIEKIQGEHESRPVNPVLANPVYLTGYIEQMGTGTTDIIALCEKHGLRKPEFIQDESFRTIIWRPESEETGTVGGTVGGNVDEKRGKVRGNVRGKVDPKLVRIVLAVRGDTKSVREIMDVMGLRGDDSFRKRYLRPAIEAELLAMLYPDAASRTDQAYYLTEKGLALLKELNK